MLFVKLIDLSIKLLYSLKCINYFRFIANFHTENTYLVNSLYVSIVINDHIHWVGKLVIEAMSLEHMLPGHWNSIMLWKYLSLTASATSHHSREFSNLVSDKKNIFNEENFEADINTPFESTNLPIKWY